MSDNKSTRGFGLLETNSESMPPLTQLKKKAPDLVRSKRVYIIAVVAISILLSVYVCARLYIGFSEQLLFELRINETDMSRIEDGVYKSSYSSSHMSATVIVSVESGRIVALELDEFKSIDPVRASEVFDAVLLHQRLNISDGDIGTQATDIIVLKSIESTLSGAASA